MWLEPLLQVPHTFWFFARRCSWDDHVTTGTTWLWTGERKPRRFDLKKYFAWRNISPHEMWFGVQSGLGCQKQWWLSKCSQNDNQVAPLAAGGGGGKRSFRSKRFSRNLDPSSRGEQGWSTSLSLSPDSTTAISSSSSSSFSSTSSPSWSPSSFFRSWSAGTGMRRAQSFHIDQREDNDSWLDSQRRYHLMITSDDHDDGDYFDNFWQF